MIPSEVKIKDINFKDSGSFYGIRVRYKVYNTDNNKKVTTDEFHIDYNDFYKLKKPEQIENVIKKRVLTLAKKRYRENKIIEFNTKYKDITFEYNLDSLIVAEEL